MARKTTTTTTTYYEIDENGKETATHKDVVVVVEDDGKVEYGISPFPVREESLQPYRSPGFPPPFTPHPRLGQSFQGAVFGTATHNVD